METCDQSLVISFPGKVGDLLYSLPALLAVKNKLGIQKPIDYVTSSYCSNVASLIERQPYIGKVIIDPHYYHQRLTLDPFPKVSVDLSGYDLHYDLSFDHKMIGTILHRKRLIDVHFDTLRRLHKTEVERKPGVYLFGFDDIKRGDKIVFSGWSESVFQSKKPDSKIVKAIIAIFNKLFVDLSCEVISICGPKDVAFHKQFGKEVVVPRDFDEAAVIIASSKLFIGVQSAPYVIADGLQHPRLVWNAYSHVRPYGNNGHWFTETENYNAVLAKAKSLIS